MNHKIEMYLRSADGVSRDFGPVELAPAKVLGPGPHPGPCKVLLELVPKQLQASERQIYSRTIIVLLEAKLFRIR